MYKECYGWRARIGVVYPASGLADMEYYSMCPPGVSVHVTRSSVPNEGGVTLEDTLEVAGGEQFQQLAADLATVRPNVIAWMCTSGSFSRGPAWDNELRQILSHNGGCPAITTSSSIIAAFRSLGVSKIALATPYEDRVNQKLVEYLTHYGFEVRNVLGLGLTQDWNVSELRSRDLNDLVRSANTDDSEAIFISDTSVLFMHLAQALESDLGKPVFSANIATMWNALRLAGVNEPQQGLGRLFQTSLA